MSVLRFIKPDKITVNKRNDFEVQFEFKPLEPGFGVTIGNALRRVLLSSLEGYAIVGVKIEGVNHEFSTIVGVTEDVTELILNLKQVRFKKKVDIDIHTERISLHISGKKECTAAMIQQATETFKVTNPELLICRLDESVKLNIELTVSRGRGYVSADDNYIPLDEGEKELKDTQYISMDAIYTPIKNVRYEVQPTRVGDRTDFEQLTLDVQTDGTIPPEEVLKQAAKILMQHLMIINDEDTNVPEEVEELVSVPMVGENQQHLRKVLKTPLEDLDLSVRAFNCLKSACISSLSQLVGYRSEDLMKFRNFGQKSLTEIEQVLKERGLHFGMDLSKLSEE